MKSPTPRSRQRRGMGLSNVDDNILAHPLCPSNSNRPAVPSLDARVQRVLEIGRRKREERIATLLQGNVNSEVALVELHAPVRARLHDAAGVASAEVA